MQTIFKKSVLFLLILTISLLTFVGIAFAEENAEMSLDEIIASYAGKKVSVIGDSISTLNGISNDTTTNTTIGNNSYHYSTSFGVNNTWWQQVINTLGMERLVINAWSGSTVLKDNKGTDSAMYKTRCVNLHNDITGEMPDVILVFGGTNDFTHHKSTLGTASAINYDTLIVSNGDGTFTYAVPATTLEAYAIMLHKIQVAYPDAEVFCANLLLRRDPVLPGKTDAGQPTEFNKELEAVIEKMGVRLVDFENCGLESTPEIYDNYVTDQNVHPGAKGMDLMSAAVLSEMLGVDCHPIIFNSVGTQRSNTAFYSINGNAFETDITLKKSYTDLAVSVTMDGEDITSSVYANGKLSIPSVTGHVVINATANAEYLNHLMQFETDICCESNIWSVLKKEKYYFDGSAWSTKYYSVTFPVNPGERISATSFGAKGSNGNDSTNGIRITYFYSDGTFKSISPADVYNDYKADRYVTVPANAIAVNIPMWTSSSSYEIKLLDREHIYEIGTATGGYAAYICSVCGAEGERIETVNFDGAVTLEGFSIKLHSTETAVNGLRSISSFDWNKNATFEENGYELLQFGAIAISRPQYEATNGSFTIDAETSTLSGAKGIVAPVWKNGQFVGNTLVRDAENTQFALTIVNYEDNFTTDVYFAAYSIYSKDGLDEPIVTIVGYPDEEYQFMNIYQLTLDMYVNGAINASNTDDSAVWNTLQSGVVTLTSSQYGTGATDMNGNAFGDSFTFKDVSNMGTSGNENTNIKITLFNDYSTGEYVAIWRGTGNVVAGSSNAGSQLWYNTNRTKMSHPKLTQATSKKITTFVFDNGITGIAEDSYAMRGVYCETYVFPKTFTKIGDQAFYMNQALTSIYQAQATGYMQDNETGLVDVSFITSFGTDNQFYKMASSVGVEKIHFPAKLTTTYLNKGCVSWGDNTRYKNLVKIWCGGTPEPEAGVIDLSGLSITATYGSCFAAMSSSLDSYICILPDGCRLSRDGSNNAFYKLNVTEIRQATYNENIITDLANHKYNLATTAKYCDLSGKEWVVPTEENTLRVLAIGNSFSVDAMEYLWDITNEAIENGETDYEFVSLGNLYIGSCSLDTHWSNIQNDSASYTYYTNSNGKWTSESNYKLSEALISQDWDIITVQQVSGSSGKSETFDNLQNIIDYVNANKTNENAKIFWHMTWAYQQDSTKKEFANYNKDQMTMYNAIIDATESTILTNSSIAGVIPGGTAVQNARTSYVGDTLTRDGYHMSYDLGRYITALTWFAYITGESVDNVQWTPSSYSSVALHLDVAKEAVKNAIASPYAVTQSLLTEAPGYTDEELFALNNLDIANYTALDLTPYTNFQKYYQSETALPSAMTSGTSTAKKYIGIGLFTKETLPIGSVIILDDGYQYRPEGWIDENTKNSTRPGNVTKQFVVTDDAWWGSFTIRGFNLAYQGANSNISESAAAHFKIYIPSR